MLIVQSQPTEAETVVRVTLEGKVQNDDKPKDYRRQMQMSDAYII